MFDIVVVFDIVVRVVITTRRRRRREREEYEEAFVFLFLTLSCPPLDVMKINTRNYFSLSCLSFRSLAVPREEGKQIINQTLNNKFPPAALLVNESRQILECAQQRHAPDESALPPLEYVIDVIACAYHQY